MNQLVSDMHGSPTTIDAYASHRLSVDTEVPNESSEDEELHFGEPPAIHRRARPPYPLDTARFDASPSDASPADDDGSDYDGSDDDGISEKPGRPAGHHCRNASTATARTTGSAHNVLNKRFSIQPHYNLSPTREDALDSPTEPVNERVVGEEPGVNADTMTVDLPDSRGSQVTLIDYSPGDCAIQHYDVEKDGQSVITGSSDPRMLHRHLVDALGTRPKWSQVRWVVVNGLSWEAVQPIAAHYRLHPLAVEDMLDIPQRIKMETFNDQTFCCFPLHVLHITKTPYSFLHVCARMIIVWIAMAWGCLKRVVCTLAKRPAPKPPLPRTIHDTRKPERDRSQCLSGNRVFENLARTNSSSLSQTSTLGKPTSRSSGKRRYSVRDTSVSSPPDESDYGQGEVCIPFYTVLHGMLCGDAESSPVAEKLREMPARSIYEWNRGNLQLQREALQNMHIPGSSNSFEIALEQVSMFMFGDTVITFFEKNAPAIYRPLEDRLRSASTMLRQSSDPAILVQAVLDASVDLIGPILNEYRSRLNRLQTSSVPHPSLQHTRALHGFITDMTVLRPHLSSLLQLIEALWPKMLVHSESEKDHARGGDRRERQRDARDAPRRRRNNVAGLYFGDVADHVLRYLQDLDDMRNQSKTLSSLLFNTISIRASDSVKLLSLVSVVFLPLTFLTGYFGMNFKTFSVLDNDVAYYWMVATPAAGALTAFLMYPSLMDWLKEIWSWSRAQV